MELNRKRNFVKEAYEVQLLSVSSRRVSEYVRTSAQDCIQMVTQTLQEDLERKYPHLRPAVDSATKVFLKENLDSAEKQMVHLQSAVDEFFGIPDNVLLPEDSQQRTQYTKEDEEKLDQEIEKLKSRTRRAVLMEEYLLKEVEEIEKMKTWKDRYTELRNISNTNEVNGPSPYLPDDTLSEIINTSKDTHMALQTVIASPVEMNTIKHMFYQSRVILDKAI